jgi:hypothetical protein
MGQLQTGSMRHGALQSKSRLGVQTLVDVMCATVAHISNPLEPTRLKQAQSAHTVDATIVRAVLASTSAIFLCTLLPLASSKAVAACRIDRIAFRQDADGGGWCGGILICVLGSGHEMEHVAHI